MFPLDRAWWVLGGALVALAWNLILAARIATSRGPAGVRETSGLAGLLIVPGAIIAVAGSWVGLGRTVAMLTWLWPLTVFLFVVQAFTVLRARRVSSFVVVPLLLLNLVLLLGAVSRYVATWGPDVHPALLAAGAAVTSVAGLAWGPDALGTPLAIFLPLLVPAGPARWPGARPLRAALSIGSLSIVALAGLEYPAAVRAITSFRRVADTPSRERPRGDLAVGLRLFPALDRAPDRTAIRYDLPLADSLGARVLAVVITPSGATGPALDSLADVLEEVRGDSLPVFVSLGWDRRERALRRRNPVALLEARLRAVDQVVRRVRPDVLAPALDPWGAGTAAIGVMPGQWWVDYLSRAARMAHTLRPRTRVLVAASTWTPADSALHAWAAASPDIDLLGISLAPGFRGGGELQAAMRVASRWMATTPKAHWITSVRSYPHVFGARAQQLTLTGTLAWATAHPRVQAVIIDGAADYDVLSGLRGANGRLRPAVGTLAALSRSLREGAAVLQ